MKQNLLLILVAFVMLFVPAMMFCTESSLTISGSNLPLTNPQQIWATYYGSTECEGGFGITTDQTGNVIVTGMTSSTNFPVTAGAFQSSLAGFYDAYVIKFNSSGQRLWATYFGGSGFDAGQEVVVDNNDNIIITGRTSSTNFPVTPGSFQSAFAGGEDVLIIKFNSSGQRIWATYYGGSLDDFGMDCAVNSNGDIFCTGTTNSQNFPVTSGAFQMNNAGAEDAFVISLNSSGQRLWATYYGGSGTENLDILFSGICTDLNGNVVLTGLTRSSNFPVTPGAFQTMLSGYEDVFIAKFNSAGQRLWATYYGGNSLFGNSEGGTGIITDVSDNIIVTGITASADFPVSIGAFQTNYGGGAGDAFLLKFNSSGQRLWATYYGGNDWEKSFSVSSCGSGNIVFTGATNSTNFPVTPGAFQSSFAALGDAFLGMFDPSGQRLWASYYGGDYQDYGNAITVDNNGSFYFTLETHSTNLPFTAGAFQQTYSCCQDIFISKFDGACQGCDLNNYPWDKVGNTGTELNSMVYSLSPFNGKIIAGGDFTQVSGNTVNHIASWNGSIWQSLDNGLTGGLPLSEVDALIVFQNKLIAGGKFSIAGSTTANNIAQWDGTNWTSVGTGSANGTNGPVLSLTIHNGNLIVGGNFTNAGNVSAKSIAQWNGNNWSAIGTGINGSVSSLLSFNGDLIAGGIFTTVGSGAIVNNITKWNGSLWSSLGTGITLINNNIQGVGALANYNNEITAGGRFNNAGGVPVNFIAKWNGSSWSDVGGGFPGSYEGIYSLLVINNFLYAGGLYSTAGTISANSVAKWDGNVWKAMDNGVIGNSGPGIVLSLMNYNNNLYAGGEFISPDYSWITMNPCESTDPIGIINGNNLVPDNYYLYQNYPNPFNPTTKIKFTLPENSFAKLAVYNTLGKEVETLVNEKLSAGSYEPNWNASGYPSGIYFYKLTANNFIQTKKMVLLK